MLEERLVFAAVAMFEKEIVLADGRGGERVRLDDVRARFQIEPVNFLDDLRLREHEQLVVAPEVLTLPVEKSRPAKRRLIQFVLLDDRAHRTIDDDDALLQQSFERAGAIRLIAHQVPVLCRRI